LACISMMFVGQCPTYIWTPYFSNCFARLNTASNIFVVKRLVCVLHL
jgi:hypothetical protein